jgi:hypothetical protein
MIKSFITLDTVITIATHDCKTFIVQATAYIGLLSVTNKQMFYSYATSQLSPSNLEALYACGKYGGFIKIDLLITVCSLHIDI